MNFKQDLGDHREGVRVAFGDLTFELSNSASEREKLTTTASPRAAKRSATARPMPVAAPVTRATLRGVMCEPFEEEVRKT